MSALFSGFTFLNPWLLAGLAILPVIWWIIRLTPPSPKTVSFSAIQFLLQLKKDEKSTVSIPWWLLLLRLMIVTLIIVGLAAPVLNQPRTGDRAGPAVLIVDNGWTSTADWPQKIGTLTKLVSEFSQQQRLIYIIPTIAREESSPVELAPLKPDEIEKLDLSIELKPRPWDLDRTVLDKLLPEIQKLKDAEFYWLSDGVLTKSDQNSLRQVMAQIAELGPLTVYQSETTVAPHVIKDPIIESNRILVPIKRPATSVNNQGTLIARTQSGKILIQEPYSFDTASAVTNVTIDLPTEIRNDIRRLEISNTQSAGALYLMDNRWQRRKVGLIASDAESQGQSLLSETHYLEKALIPFYDIQKGSLEELIKSSVSLIALGDVGALSAKENAEVLRWIDKGGVLIRFSGPKLANSLTDLVPVDLRSGNRNLDGAMSWSSPASLGPMPKNSPFAKLTLDPNIKIKKQVLANPSSNLNEKTWARLEDGTPLVTAEKRGRGRIILFHTTVTPSWSDLVLSGLFVEMLREIGQLGEIVNTEILSKRHLPPLNILDGFGHFEGIIGTARPLDLTRDAKITPSPTHPAGFYGTSEFHIALNVGSNLNQYELIDFSGFPGDYKPYEAKPVISIQAPLLLAAILLILADIVISLILQGRLPWPTFTSRSTPSVLFTIIVLPTSLFMAEPVKAEENIERLLEATLQTRLAYVQTGDDAIDQMSKAGLAGLSKQLRRRTAIEAASPLPVNIETNELIFFPLVYWPITPEFSKISDTAIAKVNKYLKGGGTILFDTRDQYSASIFGGSNFGSPESKQLRKLLTRLDIPNLSPVPVDHVLTRAFYLMQTFPGRYRDGELWIENTRNAAGNDGVASVLIGSNDWAAAWATDRDGRPIAAVIPGGARQRELATRFGINLVMYTLAGNYKADQVHIPTILERLGQ